MRKYLTVIIISILSLSCQTQKVKSDVVYFLPSNVKDALYKEVQKHQKLNKEIFIVLEQENQYNYILYLNTDPNESEKFWLQNSKKVVFLEKKLLIPLYLSMDQTFSYPEKGKEIFKKLGTDRGMTKVISTRENTFQIKFKSNGEIVK